ncbi:MAG: transaldolase family protein [Candidatus Micrarchaeota archaeon]|nr:transaldolase family protein [Candidatus Micrarchaeota archaeon]
MELFLDTAKVEEIKAGLETGCIDGVTTNPTLISECGKKFEATIMEIAELVKESNVKWIVNAEVTQVESSTAMITQGIYLSKLHQNIVVKLPATIEGITAASCLARKNIRTNVTLCFSVNQALLAAKSGASYVSPFVGRLDDIGENGTELIKQIRIAYNNYKINTKILAASIRSPFHVSAMALIGADVATIPFSIFEKMFKHPLTDNGMMRFKSDWETFTARSEIKQVNFTR